ncbi:hypothetical protein RhiirC2_719051 [Rhizophagus irregularis]|uniref:Uncharacterized protein n=1 Tax=Rhizophagus irregularis TaxID=588596 RepID=A0A2N1MFU3_9GLOM|nr:hypothetical protein RhiirC2_719051 [Rhizophagus irregularis]
MASKLVQFTFNNDSTVFEIINFFLRGGGGEILAEGWMLSGTWDTGASSCIRSKPGSLSVRIGSRPRCDSIRVIRWSASSRAEMRLWKLATSHCNSRKRLRILLASSGDKAELGVWQGKGCAVEREEKKKETDRSLLLYRARWEELLLSRREVEADRSMDFEQDRERERVLAALELERRG